ncbi:MAG TPA: copper chaperone PCu(A)C [Acidimicrobiales bacterium]|nr:copper chaperone PCu(A)C [Acidimicrobiales bacterium]
MACREVLSAALDHEADAAEVAAASSHVAACPACNSYRSQLEALHRRARLRPSEAVPDRTASILASLRRSSRVRNLRQALAAAGAAAVFAATAFVLVSRHEPSHLSAAPGVAVSQVAISPGPTGGLSVVSFRVHNLSAQPDALVGARTTAANDATLHSLRNVEGRDIMQSVDQIAIAGGETRDLGDGTSHIMLVDLRQRLDPGVRVTIELDFDHAAPVDVDGVVTT